MIYISRPVMETSKPIPKASGKQLDNNLKDRDNGRQQVASTIEYDEKSYDLTSAIEVANRAIFEDNDHFEFAIHEGTGRVMVKLINNETDEVIKEIPPEKILDLVASIWDLVGILVDERG